jgi:hypothetical protein
MELDFTSVENDLLEVIDVVVLGKKPLIKAKQRHDEAMTNIESLIRRAARQIEFGISQNEVAALFMQEGIEAEMVFLIVMAGRIAASPPPALESTEDT